MSILLFRRNSPDRDSDNSQTIGIAIGLGVGIPVIITFVVLTWLTVRNKKQLRKEDEAHNDIDFNGDVSFGANSQVSPRKHWEFSTQNMIRDDASTGNFSAPNGPIDRGIIYADPSTRSPHPAYQNSPNAYLYSPDLGSDAHMYSRTLNNVYGPSPNYPSSDQLRYPSHSLYLNSSHNSMTSSTIGSGMLIKTTPQRSSSGQLATPHMGPDSPSPFDTPPRTNKSCVGTTHSDLRDEIIATPQSLFPSNPGTASPNGRFGGTLSREGDANNNTTDNRQTSPSRMPRVSVSEPPENNGDNTLSLSSASREADRPLEDDLNDLNGLNGLNGRNDLSDQNDQNDQNSEAASSQEFHDARQSTLSVQPASLHDSRRDSRRDSPHDSRRDSRLDSVLDSTHEVSANETQNTLSLPQQTIVDPDSTDEGSTSKTTLVTVTPGDQDVSTSFDFDDSVADSNIETSHDTSDLNDALSHQPALSSQKRDSFVPWRDI